MKSKLLTIILGIFLVGLITAGVTLVISEKDVSLDKVKVDKLKEKGIGTIAVYNNSCAVWNKNDPTICDSVDGSLLGYSQPVISPCKVINEYSCEFKIFQQGGINKDQIKVTTKYCLNWSQPTNLTEESLCEEWKILTDEEIASQVENQTNILLEKIADIYISRETPKIETTKGEEYKIDIKS